VKRISYLANEDGIHALSVLRFTLDEIRFTDVVALFMNAVGRKLSESDFF
jgi:hypothetical protein